MPKSLEKRCIRAWRQQLGDCSDSRVNPYWKGTNLRSFCRQNGIVSAGAMIESRAEDLGKEAWRADTGLDGWSLAFSDWYKEHRQGFLTAARLELESDGSEDEIYDGIITEMSYWDQ